MSISMQLLPQEIYESAEYKAAEALALEAAGAPIVEYLNEPVVSIESRPTGYWNNTGIYKPKGIALVITYVSGTWKSNPYWGPCTAAGDARYIAGSTYLRPGAPEGCLVGKVGGDHVGGGSETFAVGVYGFVPPQFEGLLWLSVNDEPRGFGDNKGAISASVRMANT